MDMAAGHLGRILRHLRRAVPTPADGVPDEQLLERFAVRRDEAAFEALVRRHGPMVFGVCRRVLGHAQDAEDAFQATFLVLARKAGSLRDRDRVGPWLYGVAYRTAQEARRAAARRRAKEAQVEPRAAVPDDSWADLRRVLDEELARLPAKYRALVVLSDLEGKTRRQVAGELGLPEGTVASRLSRARGLLARRLARHGWAAPAGVLAAVVSEGAAAGGVPALLVASTAKAATAFAAGQAAAGLTSAQASALAERVVRAMWLSKLKVIAAGMVALVLLGGGLAQLPGPGRPTGVAAAAQEAPKAGRGDAGRPAAADKLRETLLALEKQTWEAVKKRDWDALRGTAADDFVAITDDGRVALDEMIKGLAAIRLKDYSLSDVKLTRLTKDAAVLTYKVQVEYAVMRETGKEAWWVSSTWAQRGGKWRNVVYQNTPVDE
jgi:RNA polymerase sigma factor (sigma-70 family)